MSNSIEGEWESHEVGIDAAAPRSSRPAARLPLPLFAARAPAHAVRTHVQLWGSPQIERRPGRERPERATPHVPAAHGASGAAPDARGIQSSDPPRQLHGSLARYHFAAFPVRAPTHGSPAAPPAPVITRPRGASKAGVAGAAPHLRLQRRGRGAAQAPPGARHLALQEVGGRAAAGARGRQDGRASLQRRSEGRGGRQPGGFYQGWWRGEVGGAGVAAIGCAQPQLLPPPHPRRRPPAPPIRAPVPKRAPGWPPAVHPACRCGHRLGLGAGQAAARRVWCDWRPRARRPTCLADSPPPLPLPCPPDL